MSICFGVRIQTYNRQKPKPIRDYVEEAIDCVNRQTYKNWKIFLIGDCYEPREEFKEFAKFAPPDKIVAVNMHRAPEREIHTGYNLWCCGGITAFNFSLDLMTELGITHCANFDDDDIWFPRHLEFHARTYDADPQCVMVCSHGHYKIANNVLPKTPLTSIAANSCNCACSWDIVRMPLRARNCIQETAWKKDCWDYWFWRSFEDTVRASEGLKMSIIPEMTVFQRHTHMKPMSVGHL